MNYAEYDRRSNLVKFARGWYSEKYLPMDDPSWITTKIGSKLREKQEEGNEISENKIISISIILQYIILGLDSIDLACENPTHSIPMVLYGRQTSVV